MESGGPRGCGQGLLRGLGGRVQATGDKAVGQGLCLGVEPASGDRSRSDPQARL